MDATVRLGRITRMLWAILWINLLVAVAKLVYGHRAGAIAMTADGVHSLLDSASNVVGLIGIAVARRPPDANHPYGHRKYETFAALGIVAMMFLGCREILGTALERFHRPHLPDVGALGYAVIVITIAINVGITVVERREGQRLQSELLLSDAAHTGSDVLASVLVLLSFVVGRLGWAWADVVVAVVIVVLIAVAGARIIRGTLSTLSDERRIDPEPIERVALEEPGVLEAHNVRSRGADDDIHLDLHILVQPHMAIAAAHELGHRVERRLRDRWPGVTDVVVHVEPALESERARTREGGGLKAEG